MSETRVATATGHAAAAGGSRPTDGACGALAVGGDGTGGAVMELVQTRLVTEDVRGLAAFYARLLEVPAVLNDYYVEIGAGPVSLGFSRCRFTEFPEFAGADGSRRPDRVVLDLLVADVDAEHSRIDALGVEWVLCPTTQPWGARSMVLRDPDGNLVNVFSRVAGADR